MVDKLIEALVCKLMEDEAWQGSLTDHEREVALTWATIRLRQALQGSFTQVQAQLRTLGHVLGPSPNFVARDDVLRALLE